MKFSPTYQIPNPGAPASGPARSTLAPLGERVGLRGYGYDEQNDLVTPIPLPIRNPQSAIRNGFTLIELLVVMAIIGILASMGMLAIRGMTKSNAIVAADRQLLDDLSYARRLAIGNHTTVYVLFIPPNIVDTTAFPLPNNPNSPVAAMITNLYQGQYTTYALFAFRSVGDQPGTQSPRYLTSWRTLPNAVYIATNKFYSVPTYAPTFNYNVQFPFPVETNFPTGPGQFYLPYIAFNYLGQLVYSTNGQDVLVSQTGGQQSEYIPLVHGSIFYARDANGALIPGPADLQETPPGNAYYTNFYGVNARAGQPLLGSEANTIYNQIYIDPLTGKARVERLEIQ